MTMASKSISTFPLLLFLFSICLYSTMSIDSLKLKLILPNHQDSPIFFGNLTTFEKIQFLRIQSQNRLIHHQFRRKATMSLATSNTSNFLRSPVGGFGAILDDALLYFAKIGIGSFESDDNKHNFTTYHLFAVDTGSSLTWLQCEACKVKPDGHCFPSIDSPFKNSRSSTYKQVKQHHHSLCPIPKDDLCYYYIVYEDGSSTFGLLAHETFAFESDTNDSSIIRDLLFGCGIKQTGFKVKEPLPISGILGLNHGTGSIPLQLDHSGIGLSVSYCLPNLINHNNVTTYLQIGDDILSSIKGYRHTPLLQVSQDDGSYYVKMFDILVNGNRLHIPPSVFEYGDAGGVLLDSGSSITVLAKTAYVAVERYLVGMFSTNKNYIRRPENHTLPFLCYDMVHAEGYKNLPSMSFMLQDNDFEIGPEQGFIVGKGETTFAQEFFCLVMQPFGEGTVIGAYQQVNHKLIYDVKHSKLWFKNQDCAMHP